MSNPEVPYPARSLSTDRPSLYPWQGEALSRWRDAGHRGLIEAVTGSGKTRVGLEAMSERHCSGGKSVVVVPGRELLRQWSREVKRYFEPSMVGVLGDGEHDDLRRCSILIATVQSARQSDLKLADFSGLLVADECHRYGSEINQLVLAGQFDWRLGLSATHERSDDAHLSIIEPYFGGVIYRFGYRDAIVQGVISRFVVALVAVAFSDDERSQYEYLCDKVRKARTRLIEAFEVPAEPFGVFMKAVNKLRLNGGKREAIAAGQYLTAFNRRRALLAETTAKLDGLSRLESAIRRAARVLVFTQTVAAAMRVTEELVDFGVDAAVLHSGQTTEQRREVLRRFSQGQLHTVVSPQLLDEGLDVPDADLAIIVAASRQRRQMIQRMGRVLRPKAGAHRAGFVILYVQGTSEDPLFGAHETFLDTMTDSADAVRHFDLYDGGDQISAFLSCGDSG